MYGRRLLDNLDFPTIMIAGILIGFGVLGIASATLEEANEHLWRQQLVWVVVAVLAGVVIVAVDYRVWAQMALALHGGAIVLLVGVLFFGHEVAGNRSWLAVGPGRVQPSELAKWTTCLVLAAYLASRVRDKLGIRQLIEMGLLVGIPTGLVALQPDHGTALIFAPIYLAAIVIGGVRWKTVAAVCIVGVLLAPVAWTQLRPYQKERILTVFDAERDPEGIGYHARQSKIAIGSGGLSGKGLYRGTQSQLDYLPAQPTDFILAVLAEELGFVGIATILALLYSLLYRGVVAARSSQDRLGTYICLLVVAWLAAQLAVNVGMVLGRLPTIGVPLPLISYGGSAMLAAIAALALIINVRSRRFVN